jgi:hypothetical protein
MNVHLKPFYAVVRLLYLFLTPNNILINDADSFGIRLVKAPVLVISLSVNLAVCTLLHVMSVALVLGQAISMLFVFAGALLVESLLVISKAMYRVFMWGGKKSTHDSDRLYAYTYQAWVELSEALQAMAWSCGQIVTLPLSYGAKLLWYVITGNWSGLYPLAETLCQLGLAVVLDYCEGLINKEMHTAVKKLDQHTREKKLLKLLTLDMQKKLPANNHAKCIGEVQNTIQQDNDRLLMQTAAVCIDRSMKITSSLLKDKRVGWYPERVKQALDQFCVEYQAEKTSDYFCNLYEGVKKAEKDSDEYKALKQQLELVIRENSMWFLENYVFNQSEVVQGVEAKRLKAGE